MKKKALKRLLEKLDSLCGSLSSTYGFPTEAYKIRMILNEIWRRV